MRQGRHPIARRVAIEAHLPPVTFAEPCAGYPAINGRRSAGGRQMVSETKPAQPSGRRNVLDDLDSRIPTNFYWYLAVLACIGGFLFRSGTAKIGAAPGVFLPLSFGR